jgi:hypothetical protein
MAACDAILSQFSHLCEVRSGHLGKLFADFDKLADMEVLIGKARKALARYSDYYK